MAGSLLGIALHEGTSFPVGKVDFCNLYLLTFREFLLACEEEQLLEVLDINDFDMMKIFRSKHAPKKIVTHLAYGCGNCI